jgi:diguanylate cyclase (GGDEF)-like protein
MASDTPNHFASPVCPLGENTCSYLTEVVELRRQLQSLAEQARTDALTGLYNYRYLQEILPLEMERTRRSGHPLAVILLDIDHFKRFNDTWGHELGNQALQQVAQQIRLTLRKLDLACRYGGEEFVILLPNTDLRQALGVAERLRENIANNPLQTPGEIIPLSASLGVDEFHMRHGDSPEQLLARVDTWLYQAKKLGRNCVASPTPTVDLAAVTTEEKQALFDIWTDSEDPSS